MRVLVTGGTGTLGRPTVLALLDEGHDVAVLTRSGQTPLPDGVERVVGDLTAPAPAFRHDASRSEPAGLLDRACADAEVVVHLASAPGRAARRTDVHGTERLVAAARRARVPHVVLVSIIGCDRVPLGYYRAKIAAEQALRDGGAPWTVLRATQFHPFVASTLARLPVADPRWVLQPIDVSVVADVLAEIVAGPPAGDVGLAGPEVRGVPELVLAAREAGRRGPWLSMPLPGRLSAAVRAGGLTDPGLGRPGPTFEEWLDAARSAPA